MQGVAGPLLLEVLKGATAAARVVSGLTCSTHKPKNVNTFLIL